MNAVFRGSGRYTEYQISPTASLARLQVSFYDTGSPAGGNKTKTRPKSNSAGPTA